MINMKYLSLDLNVTEIPTNAIEPIGGHQSKLISIFLAGNQNFTLKTGAFQHLNQLTHLNFFSIKIKAIEELRLKGGN